MEAAPAPAQEEPLPAVWSTKEGPDQAPVGEFTCSSDLQVDSVEKSIWFKRKVSLCSDLKRVEEQVIEETDGSQQRALLGRLVDDKSEEDGVNSQQRDEGQGGFR